MFGISTVEFLVIIGVLLLFVKPEELPKLLRTLGRYYGQFMEYSHKVRQMGRDTYHEIASLDTDGPDTPAPPPIPEFRRPMDQPDIGDLPPRPPAAPPIEPERPSPDTPPAANSPDQPVS